ncbi:MAG: WhiB family transcriptional regulator [Alphaproteobacteria bacterium]|nr:WhiB family transcriptional regulator [Alphaproteobacteria bacterium]
MHKLKWKDQGSCLDYDTNLFFEKYEDDISLRPAIDLLCMQCPVSKTCFAVGVSSKEYGVWGGIYLDAGNPSKEFNDHKTAQDWANVWQHLTLEADQ